MNEKIKPHQLQRTAYVYVRQSTPQQVRNHRESRERQYGLAERARALGFQAVVVIDEDSGRSGGGTQERPGFGRLLSAVCQGLAGAVLALEASRLARNNRDWHHLVDLCALTETLLIDSDGIYNPRQLNDRLVLGLKGSMAEFELNLMRQRAREAFEQKAQRGFALWELPVGFIRTEDHRIEKTPDRQVQQAMASVFEKFRQFGSARQATIWFREEQIPLPHVRPGTAGQEILWNLPSAGRLRQILRNPCYAGVFAYGKTAMRTVVEDGRARQVARAKKPPQQWKVLLRDHHPGYISGEEYRNIQQQLDANSAGIMGESSGSARTGAALLSGLLRCGRCGRKMQVAYSGSDGRVPRYLCRGDRGERGSASCQTVGSLRLDRLVTRCVLEAIQPAGVEASLLAQQNSYQEDREKKKALELALERARYEANRARRQFDAVDPENRLVASELEARWNRALIQVADLEQRLDTLSQPVSPLDEQARTKLLQLGEDLPVLWNHAAASSPLKKRILRTVLEEILIQPAEDLTFYYVHLHWAGGIHTTLNLVRNKTGQHGQSADHAVIDLVRELAKICPDKAIAAILNRLGYQTGQGKSWRASRVAGLRGYHEIPVFQKQGSWLSLQQATEELQVSDTFLRRLIREKILPARQVVAYAPWIIQRSDLTLPAVQEQIAALRRGRQLPPNVAAQQQFTLE
jgi:DNA invertase Pin-like site-specific DNA recombinase